MASSNRSSVDWDAARRRSASLTRPGPRIDAEEGAALVASLRRAAAAAPEHVGAVTGLQDAAEAAARLPALVVDRSRWAQANTAMFRDLTEGDLPAPGNALSVRMAGEELGVMLSFLASRVLGQFDPFTATTPSAGTAAGVQAAGRLLLVAPNLLRLQRELNLDPRDFQLWVCLHEQTHAVQFCAAPWLPAHLRASMTSLVSSLGEAEASAGRLRRLIEAIPRTIVGGEVEATSGGPLVEALLEPAEREHMSRVLAVMALLEGHADVVMDEVGPDVVPSVARIRKRFEARRDGVGVLDRLGRRLMGLDAKLAQYREGAAFVRGVIARVGHTGLNAVWASPDHLPTPDELGSPATWVRRVHG